MSGMIVGAVVFLSIAAFAQQGKPGRFQAPSAECSVAQRRSMDLPPATCCTAAYLKDIWKMRDEGLKLVSNALNRLLRPESVADALWAHFKVLPSDGSRLPVIRARFEEMERAMQAADVQFLCRDFGDPGDCSGKRAGVADNCSSLPVKHILLCGNIALSQAGAGTFLDDPHWLRTMIHEYAHAGCSAPGLINAEGAEVYQADPKRKYPPEPDIAIKNADSYAGFALAVAPH
jgi:hypothetical protein